MGAAAAVFLLNAAAAVFVVPEEPESDLPDSVFPDSDAPPTRLSVR